MTDGSAGDDDWTYVVTDIEVDGPWPGPNSMRSFASVAVSGRGDDRGVFEAVLEQLPGAAPNPDTFTWFQTQPRRLGGGDDGPPTGRRGGAGLH